MAKVIMPKTSQQIGKEFEKRCQENLERKGLAVCTPRGTVRLKGWAKGVIAFPVDFWGVLDGLAYKTGQTIGYQCKADYDTWTDVQKRKLLRPLLVFQRESGLSTFIAYPSNDKPVNFVPVLEALHKAGAKVGREMED
jgi:Holliday junction resolvase